MSKEKVEPRQKALRIVRDATSVAVVVEWVGGGEVPAILQGKFTQPSFARQAIAAYEAQTGKTYVIQDKTQEDPEASGPVMVTPTKPRREFHPLA